MWEVELWITMYLFLLGANNRLEFQAGNRENRRTFLFFLTKSFYFFYFFGFDL